MDRNKLDLTLLYVEDEKDTREKLSEVFAHKVKTLYVAEDGVQALEIFKKHHIHIIISDYQMPNMDGNELCHRIKEINKHTYFILLTAFNDSEILIKSIDVGVDKFLRKPVQALKLFQTIDDVYTKLINNFNLERSTVCLQEAEKIANLSYWDVNLSRNELYFSKEVYELFNVKDESNYRVLSELVLSDYRDKFLDIFDNKIFTEKEINTIVAIENEENKPIYLKISAKRWKSSFCGKWHLIGIFQDITTYEVQRLKLLKKSQSDPVLKVFNKDFIINQLDNLIKSSKRYGHPIGLIFFDIDNFKGINDVHGHVIADCILLQLTQLIKKNIRQSDIFGRWGGDEFVIINSHTNPDSVIILVNKILNKINDCIWKEDIKVTISAGVAFYKAGDDVNSIVERADSKMLEAKRAGKNQINY